MRKTILLSILILMSIQMSAQIQWMSFSQALEAQKKEPRKIVIDFYADWCQPCKLMEKNTYNNPTISKMINDNFYAVKFESDGNEVVNFAGRTFTNPNYSKSKGKNQLHQFTQYMNINIIPTIVFLDEESNPITNLSGYLTAKEVEPYFYMIANNDYKNITSSQQWASYLKKFRSQLNK